MSKHDRHQRQGKIQKEDARRFEAWKKKDEQKRKRLQEPTRSVVKEENPCAK